MNKFIVRVRATIEKAPQFRDLFAQPDFIHAICVEITEPGVYVPIRFFEIKDEAEAFCQALNNAYLDSLGDYHERKTIAGNA